MTKTLMVSRTAVDCQIADWRNEMATAITDPKELLELLDLPLSLLPAARRASNDFPLRVPRGFAELMTLGDPNDPLLRQVLPLAEELLENEGFSDDPVGDMDAVQGTGLLSKYRSRSLLITTAACAINCRYCFRRAFPYARQTAMRDHWSAALQHVHEDSTTNEIILSGGDPLSMGDERLTKLVRRLEAIPHLRRLRIHTRLPVVLPERVTNTLSDLLADTRLQVIVVLHFNHPRELSEKVSDALSKLAASATLLNQSVLLRGVNNSTETLVTLSETLFDSGVLPYYIHLLDRVRGSAHFEVDEKAATRLMTELRNSLPGYLVPRLVREIRGEPAKIPII